MPRQARLDSPGALHHVMIRGTEGEVLFQEDKDRFAEIARHVGVCTPALAKAIESFSADR